MKTYAGKNTLNILKVKLLKNIDLLYKAKPYIDLLYKAKPYIG